MNLITRSQLLMGVVSVVVVASALFFIINDRIVMREILTQNITEKKALFDTVFQLNSDQLRKSLRNFDSAEQFTRTFAHPSDLRTRTAIESILQADGVDGLWALDAQGTVIASALLTDRGYLENQPPPVTLPVAKAQVLPTQRIFAESPAGFMELCVVSVTAPRTGKLPPHAMGYLIVARIVDAAYRHDLAAVTSWEIELVAADRHPASHEYQNGELVLTRVLTDINDHPLRLLKARIKLPAISRLERHNRLHTVVGGALIAALAGLMMVFIRYQRIVRRDTKNLDEAQQLAKMGSWERTIATGKGYWSANCFRLFGLEPRRWAPNLEELFSLIHHDDRQRVQEQLLLAMSAGHDYEVVFRPANDTAQRIFCSSGKAVCNEQGIPVRLVGTIIDITEKLQQDLAKDQQLRQKEMFIARLSHDIKTPLTPLVALLPQIRRKVTDEKLRGLIDLCLDSANQMKSLVVKTIKLARFSAPGQTLLTDVTALTLVERVHDYLRKRTDILQQADMQTEVTIDPAITVLADQLELEEVFYNLISNAVKYSPSGSRLAITAGREKSLVTVSVRDNGSGLAPDELTHIFDEFFKADQSRHELDSSGLGLSICKRIIENHGGNIWAESAGKGCGTAIYFTMAAGGTDA